ncbi:exonuclease/endonuclease/phosphatase family protein [Gelidibacter pelagius]|uniref:Endonuclease/Exonuclease/phosphatase family protein n=1 Tax=Gelidibacter pelagius TaxID=2819985 RepID=A0ABS3SQZ5_9FLAO|nr:hypothetical protein [Gelidibacter pelagius]MBO3097861.1 hypothetical protein [Gelidibacter pelagius]
MKIASFNIQNLFHRDSVFIDGRNNPGRIEWIKEFDNLLLNTNESHSSMDRLRELSHLLRLDKTDQSPYFTIRRQEGELYIKGMDNQNEIKAEELTNWNGWIKIHTLPISSSARAHKAQVIKDIDPDILILQEIEDRMSLEEFNNLILPKVGYKPFDQCILIPGSEGKGREQALLLKNGCVLDSVKLHIIEASEVPSHELIEYIIITKERALIHILSAYFYQNELNIEKASEVRRQQALGVSRIYKELQFNSQNNVIIAGTLNAPSYCYSLAPLLQNSDLKDITKHISFEVDYDDGIDASYHRMGAYRKGVNIKQKDFMLLSPALFQTLIDSGLNRKAMWPFERPQWANYKSIKTKKDAASEHPALWCSLK